MRLLPRTCPLRGRVVPSQRLQRGVGSRYVWLLALLITAGLSLGACGGGEEEGTGGTTTVTVAETQGSPSAFLQFGNEQGYFADEGLDVQVSAGAGGAANVPKLVSGEAQFAGSNVVSVLLARQQGLPLTMVAPGSIGTDEPDHGYQNIMVAEDSEVRSLQDLGGKTIAINTLDNIDELLVRLTLDQAGVDLSTIELTEVPFPDMATTLESGRVDAIRPIEPFATQAAEGGARFLRGGTAGAVKPFLQIGAYVTTESYLQENQDIVERFSAGVARTAEAIADDPDAFRSFLPEAAELSPDLAEQIVLPAYGRYTTVDRESLELLAEAMPRYDISDQEPDVQEVLSE